jgi:hypothetical protein
MQHTILPGHLIQIKSGKVEMRKLRVILILQAYVKPYTVVSLYGHPHKIYTMLIVVNNIPLDPKWHPIPYTVHYFIFYFFTTDPQALVKSSAPDE